MKRFVCIMIVCVLFPFAAFASLPDISSLSSDELIELCHQIQLRLFSENLVNGVEVPAGDYIVGEDIPSGTYRLEVVYPSAGGYLHVYKSAESNVSIKDTFLGEFWGVVTIGKIQLEDGNMISISTNALRFFPYTGLFN